MPEDKRLLRLRGHFIPRFRGNLAPALTQENDPLVRFTFSLGRVPFDAMAVWGDERSPILDDQCFARLDRAANDYELSLEVLAAHLNEQQELLKSYIEAKLSMEEPAENSRGIMVVGFCNQGKFNDEILERYEGSAGLVGKAHQAAKYAYERNVWSQYWFEKMCDTDDNTEFWRSAVIFLKIVDGRFSLWSPNCERKGSSIQLFGSSINSDLKNRIERWESHRKDKLFGLDAPDPIYLKRVQ